MTALILCGGEDGRQRGSTCCQMQESATLNCHALLSIAGHTVNFVRMPANV
jgi:hypothetical protein